MTVSLREAEAPGAVIAGQPAVRGRCGDGASSGECAGDHGRDGGCGGHSGCWGNARGRMGHGGHARTVDGRDDWQRRLWHWVTWSGDWSAARTPSLELQCSRRSSSARYGNHNSALEARLARTVGASYRPCLPRGHAIEREIHGLFMAEALPLLARARASPGRQASQLTQPIHPMGDGAQSHLISIRSLAPQRATLRAVKGCLSARCPSDGLTAPNLAPLRTHPQEIRKPGGPPRCCSAMPGKITYSPCAMYYLYYV